MAHLEGEEQENFLEHQFQTQGPDIPDQRWASKPKIRLQRVFTTFVVF
jgi:hypothetical protein